MNTNNEFDKTMATEIISDLTATLLIMRDNLIQMKRDATRIEKNIDREIRRIENKIGKETIKRITEGM